VSDLRASRPDDVVELEPGAEDGDPSIDPAALAELHEALEDLRREIRARFPRAADAPERAPGIDWLALFDELRRRLSTFGMSERSGEVDEFGMDEVVLRRARLLLDLLFDRWWRVDTVGLEAPLAPPCLYVANHSGLLPWDGLMLAHALERAAPGHPRARFLVADWLVTLPFAQPTLARLGGVRACRENASRLLRHGHPVLAFPEGVKGAAKVFRERYRLKRFGRGGVVRVALEHGVPLVPVAVVGAEESHPILFKAERAARAVGLPFVPVTPTFPWLGPLGLVPLPTKWVLVFGEPLDIGTHPPDAARDDLLVDRLTERLRERIQALIEVGLARRTSVWG
jgi:1-acyl-sn-glycerol-3-phosphate acyltransferase